MRERDGIYISIYIYIYIYIERERERERERGMKINSKQTKKEVRTHRN